MPVRVRRYTRRRRKESILTRSELRLSEREQEQFRYAKCFTTVRTPEGRKVRVVVTRFGGGGAEFEPIGDITPETGGEFEISYSAYKESVASTIDDLLGFDIVPPTTLALNEATNVVYSVQQFVPNATRLGDFVEEQEGRAIPMLSHNKDLIKIFLFDCIVGHPDRHRGNILISPSGRRAYAIDNENIILNRWAYPVTILAVSQGHAGYHYVAGAPIDSEITDKIKDLTYEDFRAATAGLPSKHVESAWRRKQIVEKWTRIPTEEEMKRDYWLVGA